MSDTANVPSNAPVAPVEGQSTNSPGGTAAAPTQDSNFRGHIDQQKAIQQSQAAQKKLDKMISDAMEAKFAALIPSKEPEAPTVEGSVEQMQAKIAMLEQRLQTDASAREQSTELARVGTFLSEAGDYPGLAKVGDKAAQAVVQAMQQTYDQTGARPSEAEVAKRAEDDLYALYQQLDEVYATRRHLPPPVAPDVPSLSPEMTGSVSGQRGQEPKITNPAQLSESSYMAELWRQAGNKR